MIVFEAVDAKTESTSMTAAETQFAKNRITLVGLKCKRGGSGSRFVSRGSNPDVLMNPLRVKIDPMIHTVSKAYFFFFYYL